MADASKIFSGPITTLEISSNGSTWTDLGFGSANAEITWEPQQTEMSDGNQFQMTGLGKISIELLQTDSGTLSTLKTYRTTLAYLKLTTADGQTYQVSNIFLSVNVKRSYKPGEPHTLTVTGQRVTINPDDWVTFPS